jgi:hypothetical protein
MINFTIAYSWWWLALILLVSAALSFLLYFRNPKEEFPKIWVWILIFIRFSIFSMLGFLLLSPMIKSWESTIDKPVIILAMDNSKSMIMGKDSSILRQQNSYLWNQIAQKLGEKYQVESYLFGEELSQANQPNFSANQTDISRLFDNLIPKYQYRNVGALVLISDGIYNLGSNPIYQIGDISYPIYCVGVGDTTSHRDLFIKDIIHSKHVFVGNQFPIEVSVGSKKLNNTNARLVVSSKGKVLASKKITFLSDNEMQKHSFLIDATEVGLMPLRVVIESAETEPNLLNNIKTSFVDALGEKKKILFLFDSPHPDIAAFTEMLNQSDEYELELMNFNQATVQLKRYNLIVFHQLPNSSPRSSSIIQQAIKEQIPMVVFLGSKTDIPFFNALNLGIRIEAKTNSTVSSIAVANADFVSFTMDNRLVKLFEELPPLQTPYGKYSTASNVQTVVYQQIGSVKTAFPLIAISEMAGKRDVFFAGEGIWRWRMKDFLENGSHQLTDDFMLKLIRFASLNQQKSRFDIQWKPQFFTQDLIDFNAFFYNAAYEPILDAVIQMEITDEQNKRFDFTFSKLNESYYLNIGSFASGAYRFKAKVNYHGESFEKVGSFSVISIDQEALNLEADHGLLKKLAANSEGEFFRQKEVDKLIQKLLNSQEIKERINHRLEFKEAINFSVWLWLIIILASVEWFIRKQLGSY